MNKYVAGFTAAAASAVTGFVIHVATQEKLKDWVSSQMEGHNVASSWDVRYVALVTSLEMGLGLAVLYAFVRQVMPGRSSVLRGLLLGVILLAAMGRLVRQPIMNLVIGNPPQVVLVQDGISWVLWLSACVVLAVVYDRLAPAAAP